VSPQEPSAGPDFCLFADESGTHDGCPCYGIGCLSVPAATSPSCIGIVEDACRRFRVTEELKWSRIRGYRATMNAAQECIESLLGGGVAFNAIVVRKDQFFKWQSDNEEAFWVTYHELLRHVARATGGTYEVFADNRQDSYDKRGEVLELTTNYYLRHHSAQPQQSVRVTLVDSHDYPLLQCADILTGAIVTATNHYLDPDTAVHAAKQEMISRFAALVGWDTLHYDTMPNAAFNIWHFPIEFRACPATRRVVLSTQNAVTE